MSSKQTQSQMKSPATSSAHLSSAQSGILQRKCACGAHTVAGDKCSECKNKEGVMQRKSSNNFENFDVPPIVYEVLNSSGQPLDKSTRAFFESRFAHNFSNVPVSRTSRQMAYSSLTLGKPADIYEQEADRVAESVMRNKNNENETLSENEQSGQFDLSHVRIHTDAIAAESASAVNALAYTVGQNIVFGAGQFSPNTHKGQQLLAHELTHVAQQTMSGTAHSPLSVAPMRIMREMDPCVAQCEKEFDECVKKSSFPAQCIGARSYCLSRCPPGPPSKEACVVTEQIPIKKMPVTVFDDLVLMQFDVDIEWKADDKCDCACGEYRQFVKGHILKNNQSFNIGLCGGAKLEEDVWHEDGDAQTGLCYGHRDRKESNNDIFDKPDRASGCHYHGKDEPSVPGKAGDDIDVDLKFKGQTYDKCLGKFGKIHEWSFTYKGKLGGI
jgi:hypothetical protein